MGDEKPKSRHVLYGSAGMAAAGMIPTSRGSAPEREAEPEPEAEEEVPVEVGDLEESDGVTDEVSDESDLVAEPSAPEESEPETEKEAPVEDVELAATPDDTDEVSQELEPVAEHSAPEEVEDSTLEGEPEEPPAETNSEDVPALTYLKAAVVGHTGAGDFGIGLDRLFQRLDGVRLVALADGDVDAMEDSRARVGATNGYTNFRELLETEQPDLVCVAAGWPGQHAELIRMALEQGAHVFSEAPFVSHLKEADELVALAQERNLKLAVAHQLICDPHVERFCEARESLIGELLEMRVLGDMAHTPGGEDLLLRGTHLFDLVRKFAGNANFCTSIIHKDGAPALAEDGHESENGDFGPLLGDSIRAEFSMDSGVPVTFVSDRRFAEVAGPWGIEFIGTKTRARLFAGLPPVLSVLKESDPASPDSTETWSRWPEDLDPYHAPVDKLDGIDAANRLVVLDWLDAIEEDREPKASAERATKALEMVHAIWQAGAAMKRAYFPLVNRFHPLGEESK